MSTFLLGSKKTIGFIFKDLVAPVFGRPPFFQKSSNSWPYFSGVEMPPLPNCVTREKPMPLRNMKLLYYFAMNLEVYLKLRDESGTSGSWRMLEGKMMPDSP